MTRKEERELLKRIALGDEEAKSELIEACLPTIEQLTQYYSDCGIPSEDLYQEGCIGLIEAIHTFDLRKVKRQGMRNFAQFSIKDSIVQAIMEMPEVISLNNITEDTNNMNASYRDVRDGNSTEDPADYYLKPDDYMQYSGYNVSLMPYQSIDAARKQEEDRDSVNELLYYVTDNQKEVMEFRFGLNNKPEEDRKDIAESLGITTAAVRLREINAMIRLKKTDIKKTYFKSC